MRRIVLVAAGLAATGLGLALARPDRPVAPPSPPAAPPVIQGCLGDLMELRGEIERDGLGVAGWGGDRPGYAIGPAGLAGRPAIDPGRGGDPAAAGSLTPGPVTQRSDGPWAAVQQATAPSYEIRTLAAAATLLARRGQEPACRAVLAEAREAYDELRAQRGPAGS